MRTIPQGAWDAITQTKTVGARATFRKSLPVFSFNGITNNLNLTSGTWIDSCVYGTGIGRVVNVGNYLYIQNIPNIHAAWPAWINTGHPLLPGSRPAIDDGYVYFQSSNTNVYRF